jgi:hypothetical protein
MTSRARLPGIAPALLLAAAVAAVAPIARWCPLRWDEVRAEAFLDCSSGLAPVTGECAVAVSVIVARNANVTCTSPRDGCASMAACPMRAKFEREHATACRSIVPHSRAARGPAGKGRAYCLDDPGMSTASRSRAPVLDSAWSSAAIVTAIALAPAPTLSLGRLTPATEARPPTGLEWARPPVRGPPSLLA